MNILFLDSCHESLENGFKKLKYSCSLDNKSDKEEILKKISEFDGIVIRSRFKIDRDFLEKASHLKFIARVGAGLENIDVEFAESIGVNLISAPEGNANAVGEHALGMLLSLFRNINRANSQVNQGKWLREFNRGHELSGKTVAIIGYGNMGNAFSKVLRGFDVDVIFYDIKDDLQNSNARQVQMSEIFEKADVLSVHTPLNEDTKFMINNKFFQSFKKNIFFINTARGPITKTDDLVMQLKNGKVLGACLDVLEYEKTSFENLFLDKEIPASFKYLIDSDKVVLTPHIAGWTHESNLKMSNVIIEKLQNLFK